MTGTASLFHVFKTGQVTVVGFTAVEATAPHNVDECHHSLLDLVREHRCRDLVVDLYDLPIVSSWILGLLAFIQKSGTNVHLYHPSAEIRNVLEFTHFDKVMDVRRGLDAVETVEEE